MCSKITRREFIATTGSLAIAMALPKISFSETEPKSDVFFTKNISPDGVLQVFDKIKEHVTDKVAIKLHFGEEGNQNFIKPNMIKPLAQKLDATLIETNVLYVSKRRYTETHIQLAKDHGFDFAPIDILDAEGDKEIPVESKHYKKIITGRHIDNYDTIVFLSHFKGHGMVGFGGAIKNASMGMGSVAGKMAMHASAIPNYNPAKCVQCGACVENCPGEAITIEPLKIDPEKCIGCGSCIGICLEQAFDVPWRSTEHGIFLERLCEYAKGICEAKNVVFINVAADISKECDCAAWAGKPFMEDVGIFASTDIVAIEKASLDLVNKTYGAENTFLKLNSVDGTPQINYAHQLGMGNINYNLIELE
jgi:uncharacterized Fe-S center protein